MGVGVHSEMIFFTKGRLFNQTYNYFKLKFINWSLVNPSLVPLKVLEWKSLTQNASNWFSFKKFLIVELLQFRGL